MTLQGKYFGPLGGMAAGRVPYDAAVVSRNAGYLEVLSKLPWDGFDASTSGEKSNALPEVFSNTAKFKQAAENLQTEIGKLATVSKAEMKPTQRQLSARWARPVALATKTSASNRNSI